MSLADGIGYVASLLVLATFCMKNMLWLRAVAIFSNMAFVAYGLEKGIHPVLVLHLILFPLNVWRYTELMSLLRKATRAANTDLSPEWLQPFMQRVSWQSGQVLFREGDYADKLYMIVSGRVLLKEIGRSLGPGEIFGEIGLFSLSRRRTQTAEAETDLDLMWISAHEVKRLCEQNPGLSLYFLRIVATRLLENATGKGAADEMCPSR